MEGNIKMNILYLSCHSALEYEEIKLFTELGYNIVSSGAYRIPFNPSPEAGVERPPIKNIYYNPELAELVPSKWGSILPKKLIDWSDIIYIMGIERWLPINWDFIKHKTIVFRSIGQCVEHTENILRRYRPDGLKIVRYSPLERSIKGYAGEDAIIRFYKDSNEYKNWNGKVRQVITIAQSMKKREPYLKFKVFDEATKDFPRKLYGRGNEDIEYWGGELSYNQLKQVYRDNRIFFYTGTYPAPYTMAFQEALMTGTPIIAIGRKLAGWNIETPYIIKNEVNGFISDDINELRQYITWLLDDYTLAKKISRNARKTALELFSKGKIKDQWRDFFESVSRK